ncbi:LEA type 2 family protein [Thalassotalea sp. PLHSN55]|uniref:LEA type 2 family protein n=1 Tax=Thalassotalea sp. PLHSN55 TaxID=3435888 RepID=UPI003F845569
MPLAKTLVLVCYVVISLWILSGCASMNLDYKEPSVEVTSFKMLPANGFEQNFEIGLKLTNPNNFELPINGISYQLNVAGESLAHGVAADIPTAAAFGESRFVVPVSTSLFGGFKVLRSLMSKQGQDISYQLKADIDIDIPFMPTITVTEDGAIPLGKK